MAQLKFFGGVHPEDGKEISSRQPVRTVFPRGDCVYPLKQHMGNPSVPVVKRGDYVLTGQLIAAADGDFSANLHSSISGTVRGIEKRRLADGSSGDCIVIQNDRRFGEILYPASRRLDELAPETIVESVKQAGIVGMGGAGMPTHIKLSPARPNRIDYYIANCVECEPYLTSDYRRMLENPAKVINGLRIGLKIFRRARGILAVDEKNDDIYRLFRDLTREDARIFVKKVEHKFPQGAERQLIYAVTGRTLNAEMLPEEVGCVTDNVDTLVAINQAVMVHEPLLTRLVTVTGDCIDKPGNYRVRIGMSYRELIERAGGFIREPELILDGGTMTGKRMDDLDVPVTKLTSAIVALSQDRVSGRPQTACTRCARCVLSCPNHLVPLQLYKDAKSGNDNAFIRHNGFECSGCECCSYICPSRIPLADSIIRTRDRLLKDADKAGAYSRRLSRRQ